MKHSLLSDIGRMYEFVIYVDIFLAVLSGKSRGIYDLVIFYSTFSKWARHLIPNIYGKCNYIGYINTIFYVDLSKHSLDAKNILV